MRRPLRWRPRLSTVLVLITLLILLLPLGGIAVLRVYESALIRQTESELIAQGVFAASTYRAIFERLTTFSGKGRPAFMRTPDYGVPLTAPPQLLDPENRWRLRPPVLDLAHDPIHPQPPDAEPAAQPADALAEAVGRELAPILRDAQVFTLAGFRVTDQRGTIVATTGEDLGRSVINHEEVRRALAGEHVSRLRWRGMDQPPPPPLQSISRGTRIRVFVGMPIVHGDRVIGSVLLVRTPANIKQAVFGKRRELARGALLLLAVVIGIALLTSFMISRPVRALREQAQRAARGEQGAVTPLAHPGTREIAELSETVAAMALTLETRANYIRDFAMHVSHEFKTPLTAIQGAVELLRDHGAQMSREELARFLGILDGDARRLEHLVRRLLELARADVMRPAGELAEVAQVVDAVAARFRERGLRVEVEGGTGAARVAMAPDTLDSILSNLLDNARHHAGSAATVTIQSAKAAGPDGPRIDICVADDGPGVSAANAGRIFEPFFTTARERGGTGLGLPIVRALLRAHGGEIELRPSARGARFDVRLREHAA